MVAMVVPSAHRFRQLRIERVTKPVLGLLKLEDLAAVAERISPPAVHQQLRTAGYHSQQSVRHVEI